MIKLSNNDIQEVLNEYDDNENEVELEISDMSQQEIEESQYLEVETSNPQYEKILERIKLFK